MQSWTKKLKPIIWVVLVCFSYTAVGGSNFVYAASEGRIQKSEFRSQKEGKTTAQKWTSVIEGLQVKELRVEELRVKEKELKELDKELRKEFKETEAFLKDKKLSDKILKRHYDFVKQYEENFGRLQDKLSTAISAKGTEQRAKIKELQEFIEQAQYKPKPRPLDPNKLPHRLAPKLKPREPRVNIEHGAWSNEQGAENRGQEAGISPAGGGQGGGIWTEGSRQKSEVRGQNERLKPELQSTSQIPHSAFHIPYSLYASAGFPDTFVLAQAPTEPSPAPNSPTPADLSETIDVQITPEIRQLATNTLKSNPVLIYEYVRNNFDYEPYYGSLKGSQETLWEKAGNDFDQASLLIALYRAADIPARYVYGTIEIPIEKAMNWVGVKDPNVCADIFASNGIPVAKMIPIGGEISKLRLEHVWVKVFVDYVPSGGAIHKEGDTWINVDPSFKQLSFYEYPDIADISSNIHFNFDDYLNSVKLTDAAELYMDQLESYLNTHFPDKNLFQIGKLQNIISEEIGILPCTLPYDIITKLDEFSDKSNVISIQKIRFELMSNNSYINYELSMPELAGKRVTLSYIPATSKDQELVEAYGNIYNVPSYLIEVKAQLRIDGEVKMEGNPIGMGKDETLIINILSENERIEHTITTGGFYAIYLNWQKATGESMMIMTQRMNDTLKLENEYINGCLNETLYGDFLSLTARQYFCQLGLTEDLISSLMNLIITKGISETVTSAEVKVSYLWGVPKSVKRVGYLIDVGANTSRVFSPSGDTTRIKEYNMIIGYTSSALEHFIWEEKFGEGGISAVKAIQLANEQNISVYSINSSNIETLLPKLQVSNEIKTNIQNAVNAGKEVKIPEKNISYLNWNGIGYIITDTETGEGSYIISGGIDGGSYGYATSPKGIDWALVCIQRYDKNEAYANLNWMNKQHAWDISKEISKLGINVIWIYPYKTMRLECMLKSLPFKIFYYFGHGGTYEIEVYTDTVGNVSTLSWDKISGGLYTFVFLNGCETALYNTWANAFFGTGQGRFIGQKIEVSCSRAGRDGRNFWRYLGTHLDATVGEAADKTLPREHYFPPYGNWWVVPPDKLGNYYWPFKPLE